MLLILFVDHSLLLLLSIPVNCEAKYSSFGRESCCFFGTRQVLFCCHSGESYEYSSMIPLAMTLLLGMILDSVSVLIALALV
jgi:hypothetical protein